MGPRTELPFTSWLPLPPPSRPGRARILLAGLLLLAAMAGVAATVVAWRADAADLRGDFTSALWWRPEVPLYHRQRGEAMLLTSPPQAEQQLLEALRLDPYDPAAMADLTTVELALGNWPRAVAEERDAQRQAPNFEDEWRLANLFLSHGDLPGFWQETRIAARQAEPGAFPSIASRALTASHLDFTALRRALPQDSAAAASAYVEAAAAAANRPAALAGAAWLLSLAPAPNDATGAERRHAMAGLLEAAWRLWPADAGSVWIEGARAGLLPTPPKTATPPFLLDGDFSPTRTLALRQIESDPASPLRALLGWGWTAPDGVDFHPVLTGDPIHPTAAELIFDGNQDDDLDLQRQWILAPPGKTLTASAWIRKIDDRPEQGLDLQLRDREGRTLVDLPLPASTEWQRTQGSFILTPSAGGGLQSYLVFLHYHRPTGQLPLKNRILISQVGLQ